MQCIRCGATNDPQSKICRACGAVLPRNMAELPSTSALSLEEGRTYALPEVSYPNDALQALKESLDAFFSGEGSGREVLQYIKELESRQAAFTAQLPDFSEAIEAQKEADPDDLPHQIGYLLQVGVQKFGDALERLRQLIAGSDDDPDVILLDLQTGNDYICHCSHLVQELFARDGETVKLVAAAPESEEVPSDVG